MRTPTEKSWTLGLIFTLITAVMWGSLPIGLKAVLEYMDVATVNWFRFVICALFVLVIFIRRGRGDFQSLKKIVPLTLLFTCAFGLLGNYLAYAEGLQNVTAGAAQILIQWGGITLLLGSMLVFKERFNITQWVGVGFFLVGIILFFNLRLEELQQGSQGYATGAFWILFAGTIWAAYALAQKALLKYLGSQDILLIIYIAGIILFYPTAIPSSLLALDGKAIALLLFVCLNTAIAFTAFGEALVHWEASRVTMVNNSIPLITMLFVIVINWIIPGFSPIEPMNTWSWIGALLVVIGSSLAALGNRKPASH